MASRNRPSFEKRQKERRRAERKSLKAEKKAHRKLEAERSKAGGTDEDPDIAGIVPGPQPSMFDDEGLETSSDSSEGPEATGSTEPADHKEP